MHLFPAAGGARGRLPRGGSRWLRVGLHSGPCFDPLHAAGLGRCWSSLVQVFRFTAAITTILLWGCGSSRKGVVAGREM